MAPGPALPTLTAELQALNADLAVLTRRAAPRLLARPGVGVEPAGTLLATAGDNPGRLHSEVALAALRGAGPVQASSSVSCSSTESGPAQANGTR